MVRKSEAGAGGGGGVGVAYRHIGTIDEETRMPRCCTCMHTWSQLDEDLSDILVIWSARRPRQRHRLALEAGIRTASGTSRSGLSASMLSTQVHATPSQQRVECCHGSVLLLHVKHNQCCAPRR